MMPPRSARPHMHRYAESVLQRLFHDLLYINRPTLEPKGPGPKQQLTSSQRRQCPRAGGWRCVGT
eukprot:9488854-Pyramimonas_sp.AAC.1